VKESLKDDEWFYIILLIFLTIFLTIFLILSIFNQLIIKKRFFCIDW
jgi:hypothetical protein